MSLRSSLCAATATLALAACANAPDRLALGYDLDRAALDAAAAGIDAGIAAGDFAGAVLMIEHGGDVTYIMSGVQAPGSHEPMTAATIFPICSMTKPIVSVTAMTLVEDGRLSLDDPLSKFFPEFADAQVLLAGGASRPAAGPVTVRHLMSHTGGIVYPFLSTNTELNALYNAAGVNAPGISAAEQARRIGALPLSADPGAQWNYSHSTDVLGALIEAVTGQTLDVAVQERILDPLAMDDTGFVQPAEAAGRIASSGAPLCVADPFTKPALLSGGGGLTSTARDYQRFTTMLLNDGALRDVRILEKESLDVMAVPLAPPAATDTPFWPGEGMGFGLGFSVVMDEDVRREGEGAIAWWGYEGTHFWVDRKNDVGVIFLALHAASELPAKPLDYQLRVRNWVYDALEN
jgi:CubicO group peptidase (beta-lactamase class C family)